jgi:hypothetical protein
MSQNWKKSSQNRENRAKLVFVLKNQTKTDRFEPVLVFLKKNLVWLFFFIKTEPNKK